MLRLAVMISLICTGLPAVCAAKQAAYPSWVLAKPGVMKGETRTVPFSWTVDSFLPQGSVVRKSVRVPSFV